MTSPAAFFIPAVFLFIAVIFLFSKKDLWQIFVIGCREGAEITYNLLPTIIMLVVAVKMFCASGGMELMCDILAPLFSLVGIPAQLLPVAIMRPISGSGSNTVLTELFASFGADSFLGLCACSFMGATDTTIYTLSVYFSHAKAKKAGCALPLSLIVMIFSLIFACFVTRIFFGI